MFYTATGGHPFGEGGGPALLYRIVTHVPDLTGCPAALRPLVERCLAKDPGLRPDPGTVPAECRSVAASRWDDLSRGQGWWLPGPVGAEVPEPAAGTAQELPTAPGDRRCAAPT